MTAETDATVAAHPLHGAPKVRYQGPLATAVPGLKARIRRIIAQAFGAPAHRPIRFQRGA